MQKAIEVKEKLIKKLSDLEKIHNSIVAESQQLNTTDERRQKIMEMMKYIQSSVFLIQSEMVTVSNILGEAELVSDSYIIDAENNEVKLNEEMLKMIQNANIKN
jgi:hypothetical protein